MTGLLDGRDLPWDFVSGPYEPAPDVNPLVAERARQRRADAIARSEERAVTEQPRRRLIAGGRWRRNPT